MRVKTAVAGELGARGQPDQHLSYCTNIHPGESLPEVRAVPQGPDPLDGALPVRHRHACRRPDPPIPRGDGPDAADKD